MKYRSNFSSVLAAKHGYQLKDESSREINLLRKQFSGLFETPWFSYENVKHAVSTRVMTTGLLINNVEFVLDDEKCHFVDENAKKYALGSLAFNFKCPTCGKLHVMEGNTARRQHKRTFLCESCLKSAFYSTDEYQDKFTATMRYRHGVNRPLQSTLIQAKYKATCEQRLGVSYPMMSSNVRDLHKANMLSTHGKNNWFANVNPYVEWPNSHTTGSSAKEEEFIYALLKEFENEKSYSWMNRQFFVSNREEGWCYSLDLYLPDRDCAVEYYGDYWHANPSVYTADKLLHSGMTAGQIRLKNESRVRRIESKLGCRVLICWEAATKVNFKHEIDRLSQEIKRG